MSTAVEPPRRRVLVVEDEFMVAADLVARIEELGVEAVGPAGRVAEALDLIAGGAPLQGALLDVNLAGERSWPVARRLAEAGVPFAFVTGYISRHAELPDDLASAPVCQKPLDDSQLRRCLSALLPES